jgi:hypothetical protein
VSHVPPVGAECSECYRDNEKEMQPTGRARFMKAAWQKISKSAKLGRSNGLHVSRICAELPYVRRVQDGEFVDASDAQQLVVLRRHSWRLLVYSIEWVQDLRVIVARHGSLQ